MAVSSNLEADRPDSPKDALLRRIAGAVERLADEVTDEMALSALAAPSDIGALARILSDDRLHDPAFAIDPTASVLARSVEHRAILLERAGPTLSAGDVARVLGISRQGVDKRRAAGRLLALRVGGDWRYPDFQFTPNGVLAGFEDVLATHRALDPWVVLDMLTAENEALGDRSLVDALREGDAESVARAMRQADGDGKSLAAPR